MDEDPLRSNAPYTASFFGTFQVKLNSHLVTDLDRRNRAMQLLKFFLLNPEQRISKEDLCLLFWPDRPKESAVNNLHVNMNHLRRVLEPWLPPGHSSTFIRRGQPNYYWFEPSNLWWTDILEVQGLTEGARRADQRGETAQAISLYSQAADYYRLAFLPEDVYEDAFAPHRQEHDLAQVHCLNRLMQLYLCVSQLPKALSCAVDVMSIDPYNSDAVKTMVKVHMRQGNIASAVRQLDDFFHTFEHDMGVEPDNELLALRDSLLLAPHESGPPRQAQPVQHGVYRPQVGALRVGCLDQAPQFQHHRAVHRAPQLLGRVPRRCPVDPSGGGREFHVAHDDAEGVGRVLAHLRGIPLARHGVFEHERVEVGIVNREPPVPQSALTQPFRRRTRLRCRLHRRSQPVETPDQHRVDEAGLAAEPAVDAHRRDLRFLGDGADRQPARAVPH